MDERKEEELSAFLENSFNISEKKNAAWPTFSILNMRCRRFIAATSTAKFKRYEDEKKPVLSSKT